MKKYRKKLIREKAVIAIYQKLLIDITKEEVYNYLDSDKELANDKDDYDYCVMLISSIANNLEKYKAEVAKHLKRMVT